MSATAVPPVVLGDHGFMALYGSRLSDAEIVDLMAQALAAGIPMLSGGDLRLGGLVREAFAIRGSSPRWIKHMDAPLLLGTGSLPFHRAMATLRWHLIEQLGRSVLQDEIMGSFLERFSDERQIERPALAEIHLDLEDLERHLEAIDDLEASIVTLGGDVTDFLLAGGRTDLFHDLLDAVSHRAEKAGSAIYICTYIGFALLDDFESITSRADVAGLMIPANVAGIGMLPSQAVVRAACRELGKPVLAMHALAIGKLPMDSALPALLDWPEITGMIVGASTPEHIHQLAAIRRRLLADSRESVG